MMELGEGELPAAKVIRASKPPVIRSSSSSTKKKSNDSIVNPAPPDLTTQSTPEAPRGNDGINFKDMDTTNLNKQHRPVILSDSIQERPVNRDWNISNDQSSQHTTGRAKESRFKQRNNRMKQSDGPTVGGFPSLDFAPVGTLTRKGRCNRIRGHRVAQNVESNDVRNQSLPNNMPNSQTIENEQSGVDRAADSMLENMSLEEIRDGIDEIQSILSPASIEFLRNRSQNKKKMKSATDTKQSIAAAPLSNQDELTMAAGIELAEHRAREEKEKTAQILSAVRTPEDMDRAYNEALSLGLATELPTSALRTNVVKDEEEDGSNLDDIAMLTSLLRSTALRQRLLGAKDLCCLLKEKFGALVEIRRDNHLFCSNVSEYPPLLPVALRCLLDDAIRIHHTTVGRSLLCHTLQCIRYLMMLFIHPYHLLDITKAKSIVAEEDAFVLSQTHFMSEISHMPAGSELYPPTTIEPIGDEGVGCYRADSSAASAESDSKAFYSDPAWTLLSRMRIIPSLSDALVGESKDDTISFSEMSITCICGILALLSIRSPGVAAAIAGHKKLLPLIVSRCLSPSTDDKIDDSSDNAAVFCLAMPAMKLLCILAQQSRDIAQLEIFATILLDVQAILCTGNTELQMWSLVLLRILLRYGLATNHAQSLIHLSAMHMKNDMISAHYFAVFSRLCECARIGTSKTLNTALEVIQEEETNDLVLIGVWLSSTARACFCSIQAEMEECHAVTKHEQLAWIKLTASKLQFLASYLSAIYAPSINPIREEMKSSFVPPPTTESCNDVYNATMNSDVFHDALIVSLGWAFCSEWDVLATKNSISLEEEAIMCRFVVSFVEFVSSVHDDTLNRNKLVNVILKAFEEARARNQSTPPVNRQCVHPSRKSWFVTAEFSLLQFLCRNMTIEHNELVQLFAFSLVGRLSVGDEALASFIFHQDKLFQINVTLPGAAFDDRKEDEAPTLLQRAFLRELISPDERQVQLNHSSGLHSSLKQLSSLKPSFSSGGKAENACLPLGGIWLWNMLSSTTTDLVGSTEESQSTKDAVDVVSHALALALRLESMSNGSININRGTKLYHLANVCLYPEVILRADFITASTTSLYKHLDSASDKNLVCDFIRACYYHSRISRADRRDTEQFQLVKPASTATNGANSLSSEVLRALDDFVGDMCDCYIEYGAQYDIFTTIIRFFLRHEFPTNVISSTLAKLQPILNVLTPEEEKEAIISSLLKAVSGGLPSKDNSRRDPGNVLDSFADVLRKRDRELSRYDYVYLLAVSVLSRNLSSSSQRCECGVEAMKHRLMGIRESVFYDIINVSQRFLRGSGSKEVLIDCVVGVCLNDGEELCRQDEQLQLEWKWEKGHEALWDKAMTTLTNS